MNKLFKSLLGILCLFTMLVACPAFAGEFAGYLETESFIDQDFRQHVTAAGEYDFVRGLGVYAFAQHAGYTTGGHAGIGVSPFSRLFISLGAGADHFNETRFRYAINVNVTPIDEVTYKFTYENGGNGRYAKMQVELSPREKLTLLMRGESSQGVGFGAAYQAHPHWTLGATVMTMFTETNTFVATVRFH